MRIALTIAGSDPGGGAGIQADLKTFHAHAVFGMSVITAVTVQNTQQVFDIQAIAPQIVHDQIMRLFDDTEIHAVKIGMTVNEPIMAGIASALKKVKPAFVVLDPVMVSSSGYPLMTPNTQKAMIQQLFPLITMITPNLEETALLTEKKVEDLESMRQAAAELCQWGVPNVVVKGGHLQGKPIDVFFDGHHFHMLEGQRISTSNTHGTGCTFSAAITANLAQGMPMAAAVTQAKDYLTGALIHSLAIGRGHGHPHHFFEVYAKASIAYE